MVRRLLVAATLALGLGALLPSVAGAAIPLAPCEAGQAVLCGTVTVPLDYTGRTPGELKLHVEKLPAKGPARGTFFMIAGGPGQGSADAYDFGAQGSFFQEAFPGYDLVAFDDRGTGFSDPLTCPVLQKRIPTAGIRELAELVGDCGRLLGDYRLFFGTRDHADDVEQVRLALGLGKIAVYGVSYGTKEATAYALAYPNSVERILLDSVLLPEGPDLYSIDTIQAMPGALNRLCAGGICGTTTFARDVITLANKLEAKPLSLGRIPHPTLTQQRGKPAPTIELFLDGYRFMSLVVDADLIQPVAVALPAAVHAAMRGWYEPLKRLYRFNTSSSVFGDINVGLFVTTTCVDAPAPWAQNSPVSTHLGIYDREVAALPPGTLVGFDDWAATFGTAAMCTEWPSPSGSRAIASGPYPDVPVLVLNGDFDMRTPVAGALTIANRFKQGQLTIVPDVGHSVLGADLTGCAQSSIIGWLQGRTPPRICPPSPRLLPLMSPYRRSVATTPTAGNVGGKVGRTVGAVLSTIEDASNTWLFEQFSVSTDDPPGLLAKDGLAGGLVVSQGIPASFARSFRMIEFAVVPGVELSGTLSIFPGGLPIQFQGTFKVRGDKAARGTLTLKGSQLTGTLGGRKVVASTRYRGIIGPRGMRFPTRVAL